MTQRCILALLVGYVLMMLSTTRVPARDVDGRWANSPNREWFEGLRSPGHGPCCSDADGSFLDDPDWKIADDGSHYVARFEGEWIDIPNDALVTEKNRVGKAMLWVYRGISGPYVRCFMPGTLG